MLTVSEALADTLFNWANVLLAAGAAAVLIGTIGAFAMGSAKEQFANERISANEAETNRAKSDAAQANARALEAQLALAQFRAPRTLSTEQQAAITTAALQHPGVALDIFLVGDSPDIRPIADAVARIVGESGHWQPGIWVWTGVGPITGATILVKAGATPANLAAATALLRAIDDAANPTATPEVWPNDWTQFGGMLNGAPFSAARSEIRLLIGSKPQ